VTGVVWCNIGHGTDHNGGHGTPISLYKTHEIFELVSAHHPRLHPTISSKWFFLTTPHMSHPKFCTVIMPNLTTLSSLGRVSRPNRSYTTFDMDRSSSNRSRPRVLLAGWLRYGQDSDQAQCIPCTALRGCYPE
jgi:hypothetical protein